MTWQLWSGLALCLLAVSALGLSPFGSRRWDGAMQILARGLEAGRRDVHNDIQGPIRYDSSELEGLPAPVQCYFRAVLAEGQPIIAGASIELAGTFNMSATGQKWKPLISQQCVVTRRPGFLWNAQIAMLPGLNVRVVDSYIAGKGALRAAIMGLFTIAKLSGRGEIARGEFMRFFAEAACYPTALLPSQGVRWEAFDDRAASATIEDGSLALTLLFRFNDANLIDSLRAESRGGAMAGKKMIMLPWEGSWSDYRTRDGMTVPSTGEVAWMRPEGRKPYFVGTVTAVSYEFAP